ncbi:hypothetical protein [Haloarchaeobius iranensis]|uniref:DUF3784 domain-containing protein n=1 Tax=Haloarchaeobius iranensis TaxID=996166 RepID=A0A1H0AVA3_9EURY|nr:hypothetical protein [Haloarchaeobius iranensis]SDN37314.1 hypothetical protein SAMN05192554_13021 [Haloarchaeobius iranensis]
MSAPASTAVEWLAAGSIVTLAGVLVRFLGWTFLLAGYDGQSEIPDDVVREMAGNTILRVGIAVLAVGGLASVTDVPSYLGLLVGLGILLAVGRLLYKLNTYEPTGT